MLLHGDCLDHLPGIDTGTVDLVYLDPPFCTQRDWGEFDDRWDSLDGYVAWMRDRCRELHRVLAETGSLYLHCDPTASHYLKVMLDGVFGRDRFRNEIAWCYVPHGNGPKYGFPRRHDTILFYSRGSAPTFRKLHSPMSEATRATFSKTDEDGRAYKEVYDRRRTLPRPGGRTACPVVVG